MSYGKLKLKEYRLKNKLTQEEVANYLKVTRPNYTFIEQGKRNINADKLIALCKLYKCTPDELAGIRSVVDIVAYNLTRKE